MKFIFTRFISLVAFTAMAQTTFVTQVQTVENGYSVFEESVRLADGQLLAAGQGFVQVNGDEEFALMFTKMDDAGRVILSKSVFNRSIYDYEVFALTPTADSGFIMVWGGYSKLYLPKFDGNMGMEWQKDFSVGAYKTLNLTKVCQTKAGGYLLCGGVADNWTANSAALAISLTGKGEVSWTKYFLARDFVNDYSRNRYVITGATETTDGNYAFLASQGYGYNYEENDSTLVFSTKPDGTALWSTYIKASEAGTTGQAMVYTSDGAFVVTGATNLVYDDKEGNYKTRTFVAKLSATGELAWSQTLASPLMYNSSASGIQEDARGNYVLMGMGRMNRVTEEEDGITFNLFASVKPDGSLAWSKKIDVPGGSYRANLLSLATTTDGGFVAAGYDPTGEEVGRGGGQMASVHKYDSTFTACNDVVDNIGELTAEGSAGKTTVEADAYPFALDVVAGEEMDVADAGTFLYPCNSVLPVQLLSFGATAKGNVVNVGWTTAHEINTDNFVVERSGNGIQFMPLQKVPAVGKNTGTEVYTIADKNPLPGTSYYRLKQVDNDGSFVYSPVASVTRLGANSVVVAPNPVGAVMHIVLQSTTPGKAVVQVADVTGKMVALKTVSVMTGMNTIDVPAAGLSKGIYFVKIVRGDVIETIRVVKE